MSQAKRKRKQSPVRSYKTVRGIARALSKTCLNCRRHKALFNRAIRLAKSYNEVFLLTQYPLSPKQMADVARRSYNFGKEDQTEKLLKPFLVLCGM